MVVQDPDARGGEGFEHWTVWGLDPALTQLEPGEPELAPAGGKTTANGSGQNGWAGPCPPEGETHSYVFTIHALDKPIDAEAEADQAIVRDEIDAATIGTGELTGMFGR